VSFVAGVAVWLMGGGGGWLVGAGWSALSYLSHSLSSCRLTIGCSRLVGNRTPATQGFCWISGGNFMLCARCWASALPGCTFGLSFWPGNRLSRNLGAFRLSLQSPAHLLW